MTLPLMLCVCVCAGHYNNGHGIFQEGTSSVSTSDSSHTDLPIGPHSIVFIIMWYCD